MTGETREGARAEPIVRITVEVPRHFTIDEQLDLEEYVRGAVIVGELQWWNGAYLTVCSRRAPHEQQSGDTDNG